MFRNIFLKTLREQITPVFWWSLGFIFVSLYMAYFYPYISKNTDIIRIIETLPPVIKNLLGDLDKMTSPEGFFNLQPFSFFAPFLILFYSISKGGDIIAGEIENATLDILLSHPVSRSRVILEKVSAYTLSLFLISLFFWIGFFLSTKLFRINIDPVRLAAAVISLFLLSFTFLNISLFAGVVFLRKKLVTGIVSGFAFVAFIINAYAPALSSLRGVRLLTPFYYYSGNSPLINGFNLNHIFIQLSTAFVFLFLSILVFNRRDLYN